MKYLFWDIDGTLLLTGGAGAFAMLKVIKEHYFLDDFQFKHSLAGRTDSEIIKEAVLQVKGRFNTADAANLLIMYHKELTNYLPRYEGQVMYNVEKTLQYFNQPGSGFTNCLLTGNTKTGARLKLEHYNLARYFDWDRSVFGELSEERSELARIAFNRFYIRDQQIEPEDFIFIGDTPNDVLCARAIGARCLVVLVGSHYERKDFEQVQPWRIIDHLPDDPAQLAVLFNEPSHS